MRRSAYVKRRTMPSVVLSILVPLVAVEAWAEQYLITTVAGGGLPPTPVRAVDVSLGLFTWAVTVDTSGNLYFTANNCVFRMDRLGVLTRVAGASPEHGFSGDGGQATSALLNMPEGVAVDSAGNVYIADTGNARIRKVTPDGMIATIAGGGSNPLGDGGPATGTSLNYPGGVAVDVAANLYIADVYNNRVRKVTPDGTIATVAGNGIGAYSGDGGPATMASLYAPEDVAVDKAGNLYIADAGNNRVRKVATDGTIVTVAGNGDSGSSGDGGPATGAAVEPHGVALDPAGNLYIADLANCRIREVGIGGTMTTIAGTGTPGYSGDGGPATSAAITFPAGVAVDRAGNVYITDFGNERVRKVTANGTIVTVAGNGTFGGSAGDGGAAVNAEFDYPRGVAVDTAGNLFFADEENNRIREMATDGTIATVAGSGSQGYSGDGGLAIAAALYDPSGVAVDAENNIYIADDGNGRIRKIIPNGQITTVAGTGSFGFGGDGGPATKATFSGPIAVAVDLAGNLYIADAGNGRIRRVALDGTITTVAGTGADSGDLGDGGLAINARLSAPNGVAVDPAGNLYIADTGDSRIRRVATDGTITTVAGNGVTFAYSGDGGLAINASITYPFGVAVDAAANIYFPDIFWVRKVDANGIITTLGL